MFDVKNLKSSYGSHKVLNGVDLHVDKGEVIVILGSSGSGKTTLLRNISFLTEADEGTIRFNDFEKEIRHIKKHEIHELRSKIGYVFQNFNLFRNMTVKQNVLEGLVTARHINKSEAEKIADEVLKKVDMKDRADIKILYDNRIEIKLGSSVDIENKLTGIKAVIDAQKPGYEGTIIYNSVDSGISAIAKEKGSVSEIDHGTAGDKNKDTEQNDAQDEQNNGEAQDNGTQDQWTDQGGDEQYPADNNTDGWTDNGQNGTDNGQTGTDTWTDDGTWQDNGEAQYWQGQGDAGWIPDGGGQAW